MALIDIPAGLVEQLGPLGSPVEEVLREGLRLRGLADAVGMDSYALLAMLEAAARVSGLTAAESAALEAATTLGVTAARIRQRIGRGEIVAIRRPDGHVLPGWQFVQGRLVPGLAVACAPAAGLHPLAVARFMTRPHVDLELDGEPTAPRDWLLLGGDAVTVAALQDSVARA